MARARKPRDGEEVVEADLIPVLGCMFLMIPALLVAMEVATMASIRVTPPRFSCGPNAEAQAKEIDVSVHVRSDGFTTQLGGQALVDVPMREGMHDYAALEQWAEQIDNAHPEVAHVMISAERDVVLQTLVETMDALRGRDCSLAPIMHGEAAPEACHLWLPVVDASPSWTS